MHDFLIVIIQSIVFVFFVLSYCLLIFYFFFFQAEDGIRDLTVTGVQTCALPISAEASRRSSIGASPCRARASRHPGASAFLDASPCRARASRRLSRLPSSARREIGRASCRERV